jgi:hypothetical protein
MTAKLSELLPQLRQAATGYEEASGSDKRLWLEEYVHLLIECLHEAGPEDLADAPLIDIAAMPVRPRPDADTERRKEGSIASPTLLARVCAIMDLAAADGISEETAAEVLVQQLLHAGVRVPEFRGYIDKTMGLLDWRLRFYTFRQPQEAWAEYVSFTRTFADLNIPRARKALELRLWDRRTKRRKSI